jgi:uncharacterized membrane-anchored protein YjiN (DUF445 family)
MTELTRFAVAELAPLGSSDVFKTQSGRRAELRRMRTIATLLLVLMAAIYLAMRRAPADWVWTAYLSAFAEAGMVGACADWFAVVALFRRPLGLPIPHTAVVPENKRRIGAAMGRFITNNFLSPRVAIARLSTVDFVGLAARWLEDERNARALAAAAGRAIPYALDLMPKAAIDEWVALAARRGIEAVPAAPLASRGLSILWAQGAGQTLLDQGLDFVETTLERHNATIVKHVAQKSWRWIPKWVDDMIAAKVISGLTETLREMRDPDHPWRDEANTLIENLIYDLAHDPEMRAQGEALKQEILANPVFAEQAQTLREELETALRDDLPRMPRRLSAGWRPPPTRSADGSKRTHRAARGSIGGSGSWGCALSCLDEPKSAPISPWWSTTGTPRRSSTAWNCKSARTCNISALTGRWSAGWLGS